MASSKSKNNSSNSQSSGERIVYREFGPGSNPAAVERAVQELPPNQQNLRVQASRKGRKGKTVTVISGFQAKPETLTQLLKQLKTQCGSGGTVKEDTLEIQGDHTQKLVQFLTELGYKAKISGGWTIGERGRDVSLLSGGFRAERQEKACGAGSQTQSSFVFATCPASG